MLLVLLALWGEGVLCQERTTELPASSKGSFYTLSVYQNNTGGTFDQNVINESAMVRHGPSKMTNKAAEFSPLFPFPFYGREITTLWVTTHGGLAFSPTVHYYSLNLIRPLRMLDLTVSSTISVLSLPDRLTVQWSNMSIRALHCSGGPVTFQVTLRPNGHSGIRPIRTCAVFDFSDSTSETLNKKKLEQ